MGASVLLRLFISKQDNSLPKLIAQFGLVELHVLIKGDNSTLVSKLDKYSLYSKCRNSFMTVFFFFFFLRVSVILNIVPKCEDI